MCRRERWRRRWRSGFRSSTRRFEKSTRSLTWIRPWSSWLEVGRLSFFVSIVTCFFLGNDCQDTSLRDLYPDLVIRYSTLVASSSPIYGCGGCFGWLRERILIELIDRCAVCSLDSKHRERIVPHPSPIPIQLTLPGTHFTMVRDGLHFREAGGTAFSFPFVSLDRGVIDV